MADMRSPNWMSLAVNAAPVLFLGPRMAWLISILRREFPPGGNQPRGEML